MANQLELDVRLQLLNVIGKEANTIQAILTVCSKISSITKNKSPGSQPPSRLPVDLADSRFSFFSCVPSISACRSKRPDSCRLGLEQGNDSLSLHKDLPALPVSASSIWQGALLTEENDSISAETMVLPRAQEKLPAERHRCLRQLSLAQGKFPRARHSYTYEGSVFVQQCEKEKSIGEKVGASISFPG